MVQVQDRGSAARHGRTLGGYRWPDAGRGQRLVPLHGNSRIAVAVMPCGA